MRVKIDYQDLLGMPYLEGALEPRQGALDCYGATAQVVRRALGDEAYLSFLGLQHGASESWDLVRPHSADNLRAGDVVLSIPEEGGLHVSGVVSLSPPMVLSSARRLGVYVSRLSTIARIEGIYRYPGS